MYRHGLKTHGTFKSKTEKTLIIGGETDFCAERFGYKRENSGISPSYYVQKRMPAVTCNGVAFAQNMPLCNGVLMVSLNENRLYVWLPKSTSSSRPLFLYNCSSPNIRVHSYVYDNENVKVIIYSNRVIRIASNCIVKVSTAGSTLFDGIVHCGRVFAVDSTDRYMLRWSGYTFAEWTEAIDKAGYVRLDSELGKLLNLFVLNEKIVAVREYGITVLSVLGDARHMRLNTEEKYRLPLAYEYNSVILGGQLWINTVDGLYIFDGGSVKKADFDPIMRGYELSNPQIANGRYIYYNALKDGVKCLFEYDTQTGAGTPFAKDCKCYFGESGGNNYCFKNDQVHCLVSGADDPDRVWKSKPFVFDGGRARVLKNLVVEGEGQPLVEIDCDGRKIYANGAGRHYVGESGRTFTFKVTGNASVHSMTAEWEVRE